MGQPSILQTQNLLNEVLLYNPERFKSEDHEEAFHLMETHPFATVITVVEGKPFVSHLPLTPQKKDGKIELIGHMARANPQWKSFANSEATVIFHGPHAYITPEWYVESDVPTWNYLVAQANGKAELIEDLKGLVQCLKTLTHHAEKYWPSGWDFYIPKDLAGEALTEAIVGFRIHVESINFKKKINQNRNSVDRAGVMRGLQTRQDQNSLSVLVEMEKLYLPSGEKK